MQRNREPLQQKALPALRPWRGCWSTLSGGLWNILGGEIIRKLCPSPPLKPSGMRFLHLARVWIGNLGLPCAVCLAASLPSAIDVRESWLEFHILKTSGGRVVSAQERGFPCVPFVVAGGAGVMPWEHAQPSGSLAARAFLLRVFALFQPVFCVELVSEFFVGLHIVGKATTGKVQESCGHDASTTLGECIAGERLHR
jgi:hypothetical protein